MHPVFRCTAASYTWEARVSSYSYLTSCKRKRDTHCLPLWPLAGCVAFLIRAACFLAHPFISGRGIPNPLLTNLALSSRRDRSEAAFYDGRHSLLFVSGQMAIKSLHCGCQCERERAAGRPARQTFLGRKGKCHREATSKRTLIPPSPSYDEARAGRPSSSRSGCGPSTPLTGKTRPRSLSYFGRMMAAANGKSAHAARPLRVERGIEEAAFSGIFGRHGHRQPTDVGRRSQPDGRLGKETRYTRGMPPLLPRRPFGRAFSA